MSYDVATWADTSSSQVNRDPGQLHRSYSNLGKIYYINTVIPVAAKLVDAKLVAGQGRISPTSSDQQKVVASNHHFWLVTAGCHFSFSDPAYHWLFTSGSSLKLLCALLETTNRFDSQPLAFQRGIRSLARLLTNSKMTLMMTESVRAVGVPKGVRYQYARRR